MRGNYFNDSRSMGWGGAGRSAGKEHLLSVAHCYSFGPASLHKAISYAQGAALTRRRQASLETKEEDVQQAGAEDSAGSGLPSGVERPRRVSESGLVPTVPAAFVDQAAALHTAARLCMALTQAAEECSTRLPDPIAFLGDYKLYTLDEVRLGLLVC